MHVKQGRPHRDPDCQLLLIAGRTGRQRLQQLQPRFESLQRFAGSGALRRALPGLEQIFHCLCGVGAAREMMRQVRKMVLDPIGVQLLRGRADAAMKQAAAFRQQRVVRYFLGQRVLEGVLDIAGSGGAGFLALSLRQSPRRRGGLISVDDAGLRMRGVAERLAEQAFGRRGIA
jgi:hypothetical protein